MPQNGSIEQLWQQYFKNKNHINRNKLVCHYLYIVDKIASQITCKMNLKWSILELRGVATVALIKVIESYDPSERASFETWATSRIRGEIIDWFREIDNQTRTVRTFEKKRNALFFEENESPKQTAKCMKMDFQKYLEYDALSRVGHEILFSTLYERINLIDDKIIDKPDELAEQNVLLEQIGEYVAKLSYRSQLVLGYYYLLELNYIQIGRKMRLSTTTAANIHKGAIKALQKSFHVASLIPS